MGMVRSKTRSICMNQKDLRSRIISSIAQTSHKRYTRTLGVHMFKVYIRSFHISHTDTSDSDGCDKKVQRHSVDYSLAPNIKNINPQ